MKILAVDPSIRSSGLAVFEDGRLICAEVARSALVAPLAERCMSMADFILKLAGWHEYSQVVFEWPQKYRDAKSKGRAADLFGLAAVGMAVAGRCPGATVTAYTPAQWSGQVPKATTGNALSSPRAQWILRKLDDSERALVPASHDAIDAVGIGLYHLGRLTRRRVLPGAVG